MILTTGDLIAELQKLPPGNPITLNPHSVDDDPEEPPYKWPRGYTVLHFDIDNFTMQRTEST